jgi:hypothetical protein
MRKPVDFNHLIEDVRQLNLHLLVLNDQNKHFYWKNEGNLIKIGQFLV